MSNYESKYNKEYRAFNAEWICAPDSYLKSFERPKAKEFPNAPFIWGRRYTRVHFRRIFKVTGSIKHAYLHMLCDNVIDIYINGKCVCFEKQDSKLVDITEYLVSDNILMIRAYQTSTPYSFTSGITGGIRIFYENGTTEDILTDNSFENVRFIDFFVTEEPVGWETDRVTNLEKTSQLVVTHMHPIAIKRSCIFRQDFYVKKPITRAILRASALGCYEAHINGRLADEAYFLPSAMDVAKEYQCYDLTEHILNGKNSLSAIIGNGWYNCSSWGNLLANKPALIMELTIEYCDGTVETVSTNNTWKVIASPLVDNDLQFGERYDAGMEIDGWDSVNCDISAWQTADVINKSAPKELLLQTYPPIRATRRLPVTFIGEIENGVWLYDCGINISGTVELTLRHTMRGQNIEIGVCERLSEDGLPELGAYGAVYYQQDSLPGGKAPYNLRNINIYTAKGAEIERYSPRFCYTGFRYVYIKGPKIASDTGDIVVREMHNDLDVSGEFSSSDELLNRFWKAIQQTWYNNCFNGPTDCPTREKNFWTGDTMIFSHLACWFNNCKDILSRWTDVGRKMTGPYGYEDETYMLPWTLYRFYGDDAILKARWNAMLALYEKRKDKSGELLPISPFSCYNDWLNPTGQNLSSDFFSHCWYLHMLDILAQIAAILGDVKLQHQFEYEFSQGKLLFNAKYYNETDNEYNERIQSAAVLPLAFGLVPDKNVKHIANALHRYLEKEKFCLTTGFFGSRYILDVLSDNGYGEDAFKILHQDKFPSWRYILDTGATNMTESWYGMNDPDKSISMCHFSLGGAFSYFFEYLGGIRVNECGAGFSHIVLEPHCFEQMGSCLVRYRCKYGEILSEWHFENGELIWNHTVPSGVSVEIRPPIIYKICNVS